MSLSTISISDGLPTPLGCSKSGKNSYNFAVICPRADAVDLCLYWDDTDDRESARIRMQNRTHGVWHIDLECLPYNCRYGYRVHGPWRPSEGHFYNPKKLLLDPYAKLINGASVHDNSMCAVTEQGKRDSTDSGPSAPKAVVTDPGEFDWKKTSRPAIPMSQCVFYEAHVKGFSFQNPKIPKEVRGTYAGLAHEASVRYLKELGVTSVQLLPVHQHLDDGFLLDRKLTNYWGYNTLGYFAPEYRYAATNDPINEFRSMVRTLHHEGIEVILDVVYNHTCEGGLMGPTCLFRGFDNEAYYRTMVEKPRDYDDVTGCGNSVDISQRDAMRLVMDSLRYWVTEMGVDGFRFDLAATLGRDPLEFDRNAAFFRAVNQDPVLREIKLIAEPWDIGIGGYQQGNFPQIWHELNGKYRDCVRQFWRGDAGVVGEFATRITGSADLFAFNGRRPTASLNMVTSHDGFTLRDLVSYNEKHNLANGEGNNDGDSHNISDNHGVEGETDIEAVREVRLRQARNFFATMICSQGVPFITAGDEKFRTQQGNNNGYCQDNELSWLPWDSNPDSDGMFQFVQKMLEIRRKYPCLRKTRFFTGNRVHETGISDVTWLNTEGQTKRLEDWSLDQSGALGMMIHREAGSRDRADSRFLIVFFNARSDKQVFQFPAKPAFEWDCIADTNDRLGESSESSKTAGDVVSLEAKSLQIWVENLE